MNPTVLNAIPIPALVVGADERIAQMNAPAADLFGQAVLTRHYVTALRQPALLDAVEAAMRLRRRTEAVFLSTEASREITWQAHAAPVDLEAGQGVMVSFLDMTPMHEAGQMRRDFVANVSHELRTPLTALLGFIETLRGAARDDAGARDRFLTIMEREAVRMNRLIHDLLSLSRVESEERLRPTTPVDVAGLISSAVMTMTPMAQSGGVTLMAPDVTGPIEVPGDSDQLLQVVTNLIENAVKYSGQGCEVQVTIERSDNDLTVRGPSVTIRVRDSGYGIDPVHIPRLTERFYRVDSHRSREMGGTGLGLAIVKHIINRHRGRLRIESEEGQGSTFSVVLPAGPGSVAG